MGKGLKAAAFVVGALLLGAMLFAMMYSPRQPRWNGPVTTARELDSLSAIADAPPPPVTGHYSPTWISMEASTSTYSPDQSSPEDEPSTTPLSSPGADTPEPFTATDYYKPSTETPKTGPAEGTPAPSSDPAAKKPVDPQPNNTEELRKLLYKGK
jgi:hypothetical protein